MNEKKLFLIFLIGTLLLLGGSVVYLSGFSSGKSVISVSQNVKAEVMENSFDWGEIAYSGPKATKTFKIKNSGTETLKLTNVKTSCTCTTAQVVIEGKESPLFSMHATSSWLGDVAPGKEAELKVIFDQQFHGPSGVGLVERIISVETNDANNKLLEFNLKGNVVKSGA